MSHGTMLSDRSDRPTPVVTWLIRLLPPRGAVVALILSDVHGSEGVRSHSTIGGPRDIFMFSQQPEVLENTATDYIPIRQVIKKTITFQKFLLLFSFKASILLSLSRNTSRKSLRINIL